MEPSLSIDVIAVCTGEVPSLVVSRSIISYVSIDFTLNTSTRRDQQQQHTVVHAPALRYIDPVVYTAVALAFATFFFFFFSLV
jgi:hypothetical protein